MLFSICHILFIIIWISSEQIVESEKALVIHKAHTSLFLIVLVTHVSKYSLFWEGKYFLLYFVNIVFFIF